MDYVELHLHDHFSAMDGLNTPEEYMVRAKELGMTHLAQTNHGTLAGHREFQKAAQSAGITPILGLEAYISSTDRFDKRSRASREDGTSVYNHIILLAQNETGLKTLNRLSEKAWTEGYYFKPRIDSELLLEDNDGLVVLSGCLNGLLCKAIEAGNPQGARAIAKTYRDILGDRFFIEVQGHNPPEMNEALLKIADQLGISPVATSDCHYARKEDLWLEEAMLIISTNPKREHGADYSKTKKMDMLERYNHLYPERKMTFQEIEIYLRDRQSNMELFQAQGITRTDIYDNTVAIAGTVGEYPFYLGLDLLPKPKGDAGEILEKKAQEGLAKRGKANDPVYQARLREELDIIKSKDFSAYFLIVEDMISFARKQKIPVGPGRGSGAGSLVAYSLGITNVDPIEFGLLFFRFIDPSRDDFPDFDTDFGKRRRGEVKEYLRKRYKHVASIATLNRFQGKNSLKDAARVLGVPVGDVNKATKNNDAPPNMYYFDIFDESDKGKAFTKEYPEVVDLAKHLYGRIRGGGMHAAGVVVANQPIENYAPIETAKDPGDSSGDRIRMVAYDMNEVADLGLIKLDILGLKTLDVIDDTLKFIKERHNKVIDLDSLPLNDAGVYMMLAMGYTRGVFQAEGPAFTQWILSTQCKGFNDLVIGTSIARPGPMNTVGEVYKRRLAGQENIKFDHEVMRKHTEETLGLIVYQEQVMLAMTDLAGMSMSTANKVRKIIGKKRDVSEFEKYKAEFIEGASKNVDVAVAEKLWHDFEQHAGYSFNKSHAVVYSLLTYYTAWLKHHYPLEFMAATLSNEEDKDAITDYLIEAKRLGLNILLPNVNRSELGISIEDDAIRLGLTNIKYISDNVGSKLIQHRPFASYAELEAKVKEKGSGLNTRVLQALNAIGGAAFADNPRTGNERDNFYEYLRIPAFGVKDLEPFVKVKFRDLDEFEEKGAFPILGMARKIKRGPGWSRVDVIDETGSAGIFAGEDTMVEEGQMYAMLIADNRIAKYMTMDELAQQINNSFSKFLYQRKVTIPEDKYRVISFKQHRTKAGKNMAYIVLQDHMGALHHVLAFPQQYIAAVSNAKEGHIIDPIISETKDGTRFIEGFNR